MESNRVAVIFGGGSGIGLAVVHQLLSLNMIVFVADVDSNALNALPRTNPNLFGVKCDATDEAQVKDLADMIYSKYADVGFLFNNTGIVRGDSAYGTSLVDWRRVMKVTFEAEVVGVSEFIPRMLAQKNKKAVLVNTSSIAGLTNSYQETGAPYTVAKFASRIFTEALAKELAGTQISVHCLFPGPVNTSLLRNSRITTNEKFKFEGAAGGISDATLQKGLSPDHVAKSLIKGIQENRFYIVVVSKKTPPSILAELMRFVADDVESGGQALSYQNAQGDKKDQIVTRMMEAFGRSNL